MSRGLQCPMCGDATMELSFAPCSTSGNWAVYQCGHESCRYRYQIFQPAIAFLGARPSMPVASYRSRFLNRSGRVQGDERRATGGA